MASKVLITVSKANIDGVYAALTLAAGARAAGIEADIFFASTGLEALHQHRMNHLILEITDPAAQQLAAKLIHQELERVGVPPVSELLAQVKDAGGYIYASKDALEELNLSEGDLWDGVENVLTADEFHRHATERTQTINL